MKDSSGRKIGLMWARDKKEEELFETLKNGVEHFSKKFGFRPDKIYCSKIDMADNFVFDDITVFPLSNIISGNIWMHTDE